jgi:hypothetical protein
MPSVSRDGRGTHLPRNTLHCADASITRGAPNRSALPPKADMAQHDRDVRFVPKADILHCGKEVELGQEAYSSVCARRDV